MFNFNNIHPFHFKRKIKKKLHQNIRLKKKHLNMNIIINQLIRTKYKRPIKMINQKTIHCTHNAGFFSCCSVKLNNIINYINLHNQLPVKVDSSKQFNWYKKQINKDITFEYFEHYNNINNISTNNKIARVNYIHTYQYKPYHTLNYKQIIPIVTKYFTPSKNIKNIIENIKKKYCLIYDNICVLFYRGNDKKTETALCKYEEYLNYANKIININPNIQFLIQSDETEFIDYITDIFPNNSFYFKDEIRHINKCNSTVDIVMKKQNNIYSKYYLAITIIMAKCKYVVCGSGNCSIWIMFYRGNNNNTCQYNNGKWYDNI